MGFYERNVVHLSDDVRQVLAVDAAPLGRKLAAARVAARGLPVHHIGLDGEHLPLEDASVDHVLTTWTLCTIPDAPRALGEIRRVLRPGGTLHFVEHGRSPDERVRRWQDRLTPLQRKVAGGCHLNRPIDQLVADAGLDVEHLHAGYIRGPKTSSYTYRGVARR